MIHDELLLASETSIDNATRTRRQRLVFQFNGLPSEAFTRLQYLQVQIGCFNRCTFCSQSAGVGIWQASAVGLGDLIAALKCVTRRRGIGLGMDRTVHRPGVLFPYMDNDIASYAHLERLVEYCAHDLGTKLRISTVGYARSNRYLALTHDRIVTGFPHIIDGIRFSLTPYAVGYRTNREEYIADLAAALRTWKPYVDRVGASAATAAVELRFAPLVYSANAPLYDEIVDGRHVVAAGPHLVTSMRTLHARPKQTRIAEIHGREASYTRCGEPYLHLISDKILANGNPARIARAALEGPPEGTRLLRQVFLHTWSNADGPYYAIDSTFAPDGRYRALHFYPQTDLRRKSGYIDSTRHFLNALIAYKMACGVGRREQFPQATTTDICAVINRLADRAKRLAGIDHRGAAHILHQILPLVEAHAAVLAQAGYPPTAFFDPNFTIDTGQIVNQGKAMVLFRGLAATEDEPLTPREERGYGDLSISSVRGTVWRIAPTPTEQGPLFTIGGKNTPQERPAFIVEELDPRHLRPVNRTDGQSLRRYVLDGIETERLSLPDADALLAYPGALDDRLRHNQVADCCRSDM
jgi:hypothetical protein